MQAIHANPSLITNSLLHCRELFPRRLYHLKVLVLDYNLQTPPRSSSALRKNLRPSSIDIPPSIYQGLSMGEVWESSKVKLKVLDLAETSPDRTNERFRCIEITHVFFLKHHQLVEFLLHPVILLSLSWSFSFSVFLSKYQLPDLRHASLLISSLSSSFTVLSSAFSSCFTISTWLVRK